MILVGLLAGLLSLMVIADLSFRISLAGSSRRIKEMEEKLIAGPACKRTIKLHGKTWNCVRQRGHTGWCLTRGPLEARYSRLSGVEGPLVPFEKLRGHLKRGG